MNTKQSIIVSLVLISAAVGFGMYVYPDLPTEMASHWGASGEVNGTVSKFWGVFLLPLITLALYVFLLIIPNIDPLHKNVVAFRRQYNVFVVLFVAFMVYVYVLTILWNMGARFPMGGAIIPAVGVLIFYIGVLLRHTRRNWFVGIRTPWTMTSDAVWEKTHRLGSDLFKLAGAVTILSIVVPTYAFVLAFVPVVTASLIAVVYSYVLFRAETKRISRKGNL